VHLRRALPLSIIFGLMLSSSVPTWAAGGKAFDQKYRLYGKQLKNFVDAKSGMVHYRQWLKKREGLDAFIKSLSLLKKEDYEKFSEKDRGAFWVNVYNALAIKSVLDHYPVKQTLDYYPADSVRQFNEGWEVLKFDVMGQPITLYDIEHDRLRRGLHDPRLHFVVASTAKDGPKLSVEPFVAASLDDKLDLLTRQFFEQANALTIDEARNSVRVSKIFSWFTLDFAARAGYGKAVFPPPRDEDIILDFIANYLPAERRQSLEQCRARANFSFDYLPFDWSLNDADKCEHREEAVPDRR